MPTLETDVLADLQSADAQRRLLAVQSFTLSETVFSVDVYTKLGQLAKDDPFEPVREAAAAALRTTRGRMKVSATDAGAGTMRPEMISSILATAESAERQRLLSALQQRDDPSVLPPVIEALSWETDDRVIAKILSLIGRHGTLQHLGLLRRYLDHPDPKVLATALDAVGALAHDAPPPVLLDRLSVIAATHQKPDVRFVARRVVNRLRPVKPEGDTLPVDIVGALAALSVTSDPRRIARLIMVVKEKGSAANANDIKQYLKHPDPRVCANTVEALVALASEDVLPALFPLLAREDNRLRANLMLALYPRHPEQVMGYVGRMLKSDKMSYRVSGLYCAQFMEHGELYPTVMELMQVERDTGFFTMLLDWAVKHGPKDRVARDLDDLAAVRFDRAPEIESKLALLRRVSAADPADEPTLAPPRADREPPEPPTVPGWGASARPAAAPEPPEPPTVPARAAPAPEPPEPPTVPARPAPAPPAPAPAPVPAPSDALAAALAAAAAEAPKTPAPEPARSAATTSGQIPLSARTSGSIPVSRVTGTISKPPGVRSTGKIAASSKDVPPEIPRWRKLAAHPATLAVVGLSGLCLAVMLAIVKPPEPAGPIGGPRIQNIKPDLQPHKAMVLSTTEGASGTEIVLFGNPFKLRTDALKGQPIARGTTIWIVEPKLARDKDGNGYLTCRQVVVGETPPVVE